MDVGIWIPVMSDVIKILPDHIANQIAAGEVVQRPSSVVKELMENAVDAGAMSVKVIIKQAGKELIRVVDDGCGMGPQDARNSFLRHATSKISSAEDLFRLHTKGFRGEALASIAAVAQSGDDYAQKRGRIGLDRGGRRFPLCRYSPVRSAEGDVRFGQEPVFQYTCAQEFSQVGLSGNESYNG